MEAGCATPVCTVLYVESSQRSVVIIGAGVVGTGIALACARKGWATTVIERNHAPGTGSTAASSAVVRFTYSTHAGTAMAYEGVEYWRNWAEFVALPAGSPLTGFVQCGMVFFDDESGLARLSRSPLEAVGVPYEWWSVAELRQRLPFLSTQSWFPPSRPDDDSFFVDSGAELGGAMYTAEAGYVTDPQLAAQNLAEAAEAAGAVTLCNETVVEVLRSSGASGSRASGVVLASGKRIACDVVINAAGPHSGIVNTMAGVLDDMTVATKPLRQQVDHVRAPAQLAEAVRSLPACADFDSGMYFRPDGDAILVGGVEADCDPMVWFENPDDCDIELDPSEWEAHVMRLARRIPDLGVPHERKGVVGVYDVSDDWMPILDRSSLDGFYMAVGTSGNQFKNGPIIGDCMVSLIEAIEGGRDHDHDPVVVTGRYRGLNIDMGTFSRRRRIADDGAARGVLG